MKQPHFLDPKNCGIPSNHNERICLPNRQSRRNFFTTASASRASTGVLQRAAVYFAGNRASHKTRTMTTVQWSESSECLPTSISDRVYGCVELPRPLLDVIDTRQYQRLRRIQTLGFTSVVYPAASATRFEHCIGVCHLAGELMRSLQRSQPELDITDNDVLAVMLAGLCHDIGHGPYSHFFDIHIIPRLLAGKGVNVNDTPHEHELYSTALFDHMLNQNPEVKAQLDRHLTAEDYLFIKEMIDGVPRGDTKSSWPYAGRPECKSFLYDIVSNKHDGMDVDRLDYLMRDQLCTGVSTNVNMNTVTRLISHIRVLKAPSENNNAERYRLCFAEKVFHDIANVYSARYYLHCTVYQHKTVKAFEHVFIDVFMDASKVLRFQDSNGNLRLMEDCVSLDNMQLYEQLDDSIVDLVRHSTDDRLRDARRKLAMIDQRQAYKMIGEMQNDTKIDVTAFESYLVEHAGVDGRNLIVSQTCMHHGSDVRNPMLQVLVYPHKTYKNAKPRPLTIHEARYSNLSATMKKYTVFVFCRDRSKYTKDDLDKIEDVIRAYGSEKNISVQKFRRQSTNPNVPPIKKAKSVPVDEMARRKATRVITETLDGFAS